MISRWIHIKTPAWIAIVALIATFLSFVPLTPAMAAAPTLSFVKQAPTQVLAGENPRYTLTASNPSVAQYNLSFSDLLPKGATYAGGISPAQAGAPTTSMVGPPGDQRQLLVWSNVSDLGVGESSSISFNVNLGPDGGVVGKTVTNDAHAAASSDARDIPDFDPTGVPIVPVPPDPETIAASASSATTTVSAIAIAKSEPSPERELLRGVHDQRTIYTLTVTNNGIAPTEDIEVTDYIPAGLEYLACGDVDNTPNSEEYPGAPPLGDPPLNPSDCLTPDSVDTVADPSGYPAGVYTKVTWTLPAPLAAGASDTIKYVAGIPLQMNTVNFTGGTPAGALTQGANLNNNNGASTRETAGEATYTNRARVVGNYTGPMEPPAANPVEATTSETVTSEDLRLRKSVSPGTFNSTTGNDIATYSLKIDTSEYVTGSGIVLTDVVPDGLCPLNVGTVTGSGAPSCGSGGNAPTGATVQSASYDFATGQHTIIFDAISLGENATTTITFDARMMPTYSRDGHVGQPTAAGDSFTNTASVTGTTAPIAGVSGGPETVNDASSATQTSQTLSFGKTMKPRASSADCTTGLSDYVVPPTPITSDFTFREGDRACFKLRIDFPNSIDTRNPVVADFLPANAILDDRLAQPWQVTTTGTDPNTLLPGEIAFANPGPTGQPTWTLGADGGGYKRVAPGAVFEITVAARITAPAPPPDPDVTGNLMKLNYSNTSGQGNTLRDEVDFSTSAAAAIDMQKGVYQVNTPGVGPLGPGQDNEDVRDNSIATFRLDVNNPDPTAPASPTFPVVGLQTYDVLPVGITCDAVGNFQFVAHQPYPSTDAIAPQPLAASHRTCYDELTPGRPSINPAYGTAAQSVIVWDFPTVGEADVDDYSILADETMTLLYDVTMADVVPNLIGVGRTLTNEAGIRSFDGESNISTPATYYPANNVDAAVLVEDQDAAAADDNSSVFTPPVTVGKLQTTSIDQTNNNTPDQATIGEDVTYTISTVVPAHTTVYDGVLTDVLPTGLNYVSASTSAPGGFVLNGGSTTTLTFPSAYSNSTSSDETFTVTITGRVAHLPAPPDPAANANGVVRTNTATFTSNETPGGAAGPTVTDDTSLTIVEPSPTIAKTRSPNPSVAGGEQFTYTLTATNASGRPPSHRTQVVDCLSGYLTFVPDPTPNPDVAVTPGDGSNGCASGTTKLTWDVGTLQAGSPKTLVFTVQVAGSVPGGITIPNTATLTGNSLSAVDTNDQNRTYTQSGSRNVTTSGAVTAKTVDPTAAAIGQQVTFTTTFDLPAHIDFYNLSAIDILPAGLNAAVTDVAVTCKNVPADTDCTPSPAFTTLTSSSQTIGWLFGDYTSSSNARRITLTYKTRVLDIPGSTAGSTLTNTIRPKWDSTDRAPGPTAVGYVFDVTGSSDPAAVTVTEPSLTISETVSDATPAPNDSFTYTLTVSNGSGANRSAAYDVDVFDCVPTGVAAPTGISDGGSYAPGDTTGCPSGGSWTGKVIWTDLQPAGLAPGASFSLTYSATLAASNTLTAAPLTTSADISSYWSLPATNPGPRREYTVTPEAGATVTPSFPQVVAEKTTPDGSTAYIDDPLRWEISLTNTGGSRAYGVDAVDVLPNNWTYVPGSAQVSVPGQSTVQIDPVVSPVVGPPLVQTLTWTNLGELAADPTKHIVITFQATPTSAVTTSPGVGHSTAQTNTVTPSAEDATGASGNASGLYGGAPATAPAYVDSADLRLTKTHTPATWIAGQQGTWKVAVTNNGPDSAVGPFVVTDTLPSGLTLDVPASGGTDWGCTQSGATYTCTHTNGGSPLASGASLPDINIVMTVPSNTLQGAQFTNTATVAAETYDPVPGNNTDDDQVTVAAQADVKIAKTTTTSPVVAGQSVTYSLVVDNVNGPSVSQPDITVTDTLPASMSNATASGTGWDCTVGGAGNRNISCIRNQALTVGQVAPTITVTADLASGTTGNLVNTAVVTPTTTDPVPGNNTSTVTDPIGPRADLVMTKEANGQLTPGDAGSYTMTVQNLGPSDAAANVAITDTLQAGLTYAGFEDVTGTWGCSAAGQVVTCVLGGGSPTSLAAGETRKVKVTVDIAQNLDPADPIINEACVASPTTDPVPGNNCSTTSTGPVREVDLSIVKDMSATVVAGNQMDFTLDVRNDGPSDSSQPIVVSDTLPAQFDYVSATGTGWTCDYQSGTRELSCERTSGLAKNTDAPTITVTVDVKPDAGPATIPNTATVAGPDNDPVPANNTFTDQVQVDVMTDLILTKTTQNPTTVRAGQNATFTIAVSNSGPSTAANVSVTETLPAGMTLVSATGTGWDCTSLVCSRNSLAPGSAPEITVVARVSPSTPDGSTLRNVATVSTSSPESDPDNNTDRSDVDTVTEADLGLTKTHAGGNVRAGEQVTYTLAVRNYGPSDAQTPIRVVDQLPAGMTYVGDTGAWICVADPVKASGQKVTCTLPGVTALAADANAPDLVMTTLIDADQGVGDLTNEARVTSATTEPAPDPHPNNDSDTVTIDRRADLAIVKAHTGAAVVGQTVPFTLQVTNNGPSTAKNVAVTDTFPTGLEPKSASGTNWNCDIAGQKVTCTQPGTLKGGAAEPITVVADVKASGYPKVENSASVNSDTTDPKPENNSSTDSVDVPPRVDLTVTKTHTGSWRVGQEGEFTIIVSNNGPTTDPGPITVTDTLPAGLEYVSMSGSGYRCSAVGQTVTCTGVESLDVGGKVTFTLRVRALNNAVPSAENTVSVTSPAVDVLPDNNTARDRVDVSPAANGRVPVPIEVDSRPGTFRPKPGKWNKIVKVKKPSKKKFNTEIKVKCKIQGQSGKSGVRYCKVIIRPDGTVKVRPTTCSTNVRVTVTVISVPKPKYRDGYERTRWTKSWKVSSGKSLPCTNANG